MEEQQIGRRFTGRRGHQEPPARLLWLPVKVVVIPCLERYLEGYEKEPYDQHQASVCSLHHSENSSRFNSIGRSEPIRTPDPVPLKPHWFDSKIRNYILYISYSSGIKKMWQNKRNVPKFPTEYTCNAQVFPVNGLRCVSCNSIQINNKEKML